MWRERLTTSLALILLMLLTLGSYWFAQRARVGQISTTGPAPHEIDSFAEHVITHRINSQGRLEIKIQAERLDHFPDDNTTQLSNRVLIEQIENQDHSAIEIKTERATIYTVEQRIRSDQPVTITQGQSIITGIGFMMDIPARNIQILKNVKALLIKRDF